MCDCCRELRDLCVSSKLPACRPTACCYARCPVINSAACLKKCVEDNKLLGLGAETWDQIFKCSMSPCKMTCWSGANSHFDPPIKSGP